MSSGCIGEVLDGIYSGRDFFSLWGKVSTESKADFSVFLTTVNLFAARGCRPGKTVQMTEAEVRGLCLKSREIFLSQPILLELEAPLKICGKFINI